jgi:hypothetical protein
LQAAGGAETDTELQRSMTRDRKID